MGGPMENRPSEDRFGRMPRANDFIGGDDASYAESTDRDTRGQLRQTIDELEGRIDVLGNQLDHLFRAIDPILTPEQPRNVGEDTAAKAEIDRRSPMVKHLDRLIRNVKDLTDAVVVFEQRVDV